MKWSSFWWHSIAIQVVHRKFVHLEKSRSFLMIVIMIGFMRFFSLPFFFLFLVETENKAISWRTRVNSIHANVCICGCVYTVYGCIIVWINEQATTWSLACMRALQYLVRQPPLCAIYSLVLLLLSLRSLCYNMISCIQIVNLCVFTK